jgi:hypothetical protein
VWGVYDVGADAQSNKKPVNPQIQAIDGLFFAKITLTSGLVHSTPIWLPNSWVNKKFLAHPAVVLVSIWRNLRIHDDRGILAMGTTRLSCFCSRIGSCGAIVPQARSGGAW